MATNYISLKVILDKLLRNPMLEGLTYEAAIDYTVDFIRIVGVPNIYIEDYLEDTIVNHKVKLPCNFIEDIQILINDVPARGSTDTFHEFYNRIPDNTHWNYNNKSVDYTFDINNDYIITSERNGNLKMAYRAIKVDNEGYPMIVDNSSFTRALEWYCKLQYYTILWERGKLTDKVLQHTEQEYCWAVGACETSMHKLTLSKAESLFNSFRTLLVRDNEFKYRWRNDGAKELIKVK